jgi:hypothetical protein
VVLPGLTTALLTVVLVLRKFTMASLDLYPAFPVWILALDQTSGQISVAALLDALFITCLVRMAIIVTGTRHFRRTGRGQLTGRVVAPEEISRQPHQARHR